MIRLVVIGWIVLSVAMTLLWLRQVRTKNATSVDVAWSAGLVFLTVLYAVQVDGDLARRAFIAGLASIWALRLAVHLLRDRVLKASEEDGRYQALRKHWGENANRNFLFFYLAQAGAAVLFSIPVLAAMQGPPLGIVDAVAALVWIVAVSGEAIADRQLARFRSDPANKGQVCQSGLWRYSRHPNYFFEWMHWWTYVLAGRGAVLTWIGPVFMWIFLFRLTGIPYTEMRSIESRGHAYRRYQRTTSVFIPWFPREET